MTTFRFALIFVVACAMAEPPKLRLDPDVRPVRYQLDLRIAPRDDEFAGKVDIELKVLKPTGTIWLNARELKFDGARITAGGKTQTAKIETSGTEFAGFSVDAPIPAGAAKLHIEYHARFNTAGSDGLFKEKDSGTWYAYTQFESIDARKAFPCFDEPSFKTPWQVTVHVNEADAAVSNTPMVSRTAEPGGHKKVVFAETKPLPSYLIAVGVGPFDFVDGGKAGANHTALRIITPKGKAAQAKYAAEVTAPLLVQLEKYFGIPYPYEKLDILAVPLFGGAMENAGLITCDQDLELRDPPQDSIDRRRTYSLVIAHEMAHQWFGDLVTTAWWNDIWLNEAFASWMDSKIMRQWKPEWNTVLDEQNTRLGAMGGDELVSARKIRQPIESNDDIANAFDGITYSKGEAVIGMFESWMGEDAFRRGVQRYLRQYSWRNATAADFLDSLSSEGGKPVGRAFSTFLDQAGVPVVSVGLTCEGAGGATLHLSQTRALPLGPEGAAPQTWQIPVCLRYGDGTGTHRECTLMTEPSTDWKLTEAQGCPAWVDGNADGKGYYFARYEGDLGGKLFADRSHFSAAELVSALGDIDALSSMGAVKSADAMALAVRFAGDPVRQVVETSLNIIGGVHEHLLPQELRPNYARLVDKTFSERAAQLGWTAKAGESAETRLLRASIVPFVALWGSDQTLASEARQLAVAWLADRKALDGDIAGRVLTVAARTGDEHLFKQFEEALAHTEDQHERQTILGAMGSFRDPHVARAAMDSILQPGFDLREANRLLMGPLGMPETRRLPFEFVKENYEAIAGKIPAGSTFGFGELLPLVGASFCDDQSAEELKTFFEPRVERFAGTRRNLAQTLESIRICSAYESAQQASVNEYLRRY